MKDKIGSTKPSKFKNDIIEYNSWFEDTRNNIIKEEGPGYNKYICSMFRVYLTCEDEEFINVIKDEQRIWIQGKLSGAYSYCDLIDLGRVTFNNFMDEKVWTVLPKHQEKVEEMNYLVLATA